MEEQTPTYAELEARRAHLLALLEMILVSPRPEDREDLMRARIALERVEHLLAAREYVW